jgi:hypothetical protein
MAHEAGFLANEVKKFDKVELIAERGGDDYGWWTTNISKVKQAYAAWAALSTGQIQFLSDWVCENPYTPDKVKRRSETLEKFGEQLRRYGEYEMATKNALSIPKVGVSGCIDKEGRVSGLFNDDLAIAFCMNIWLWGLLCRREIEGFNYSRIF